MIKLCPECEEKKEQDQFFKQAQSPDGFAYTCKQCTKSKRQVENIRLQKQRGLSYEQGYRWRLRCEVLGHYAPSGHIRCACCGEKHLEFLAIDHIEGGGGKHRKQIKCDIYTWLKRNGFPSGFRVLCHNCNQSLGHYGYCPHKRETPLVVPRRLKEDQREASDQLILEAALKLQTQGMRVSVPNLAQETGKVESSCSGIRRRLMLAGNWPYEVEEKYKNKKYR